MEDEPVTYELLQDILRAERRSNRLAGLPPRFWSKTRELLTELEAAFRNEQEQDPFSRRAIHLTDEVKNARAAAEGIWALRERKLALHALADDRHPDGAARTETKLFDALRKAFVEARVQVLPDAPGRSPPPVGKPEAGEQAPPPGGEPAATPPLDESATAPPVASAQAPGTTSQSAPPVTVPPDTPNADMVTIRALADLPPFVGPDMATYRLQEGDVAVVPDAIADLLVRRGKAAAIQTSPGEPSA